MSHMRYEMCAANISGAIADISLADCSSVKDKPKKKRCDTCRKRVGLTGMLFCHIFMPWPNVVCPEVFVLFVCECVHVS